MNRRITNAEFSILVVRLGARGRNYRLPQPPIKKTEWNEGHAREKGERSRRGKGRQPGGWAADQERSRRGKGGRPVLRAL